MQNRARVLPIGTGFKDYKSGQEGLQIGTALEISNRDKNITNRSRDFGAKRFKIWAREITYKPGQGIQIGAGVTNWCRIPVT